MSARRVLTFMNDSRARPHRRALLLAATLALAGCGTHAPDREIRVTAAAVPAPPPDAPAAVYFVVRNGTDRADTLVGISTPVADRAELHRTMQRGAGTTMAPVRAVPLPPGGEIRFAPGGYHVMLSGLRRPLAVGDTIQAELRFRRRGSLPFRAPVVSYAELARILAARPAAN